MKRENLEGQTYGRLLAVKRIAAGSSGHTRYRCLCECGKTITAYATNLKRLRTTSCGCYAKEVNTKHAMYGTPTYHSWRAMIQRCTNPNNKDYAEYGGRGITVAPEWLTFERFYADMGKRRSKRHSLDRIDANQGYCKDNCRWATAKVQARNQRRYYQEYEQGPF